MVPPAHFLTAVVNCRVRPRTQPGCSHVRPGRLCRMNPEDARDGVRYTQAGRVRPGRLG